ncbi:MAG: PIN domain-containing protein [Lachnospiraceae bacterium]|nr:PIN domain-containing protein [Lachnospiraceae bacterium]
MRALIDTCIIIDALQQREPFCQDAQTLFLAAANHHFTGYITAKSATDIYYLVHKSTHSDKETRRILNTLFTLFDLLETTGQDCKSAISSSISDYEDAVMVESALHSDIDCIVTRNLKDYQRSPVSVLSPGDFITRIEADK